MITSINDFKILHPNIVNFKKLIKVKSLHEWEYEYVHIENGYGYWIAESPFHDDGFELYKNFVSQNPIHKLNNEGELNEANPLATINLPSWSWKDIAHLLKLFYCKHISRGNVYFDNGNEIFSEWGNIYDKSIVAPLDRSRLPHIDCQSGIVSNLWFTSHTKEETGTVLYKYLGKFYGNYYDFHVDFEHPLHKEWDKINNMKRTKGWKNLSDDELEKWGFIKIAVVPTHVGGMTLYEAGIPHSVYIGDTCNFRWSHSFGVFYK